MKPCAPSKNLRAIEELTRDRSVMSPSNANREVYRSLKNGVKVSFRGKENEEIVRNVQVIDWNEPSNNDFFLASQFWI
ncbi:MAG: type I restriction endonuclease [Methanobacteriota archaeon]